MKEFKETPHMKCYNCGRLRSRHTAQEANNCKQGQSLKA